jgi:tryptophan halogenase
LSADFFIDASGFRSELLGKAMGEPFVSFASTLFCDRAIVGSWPRNKVPILPYTIAETMDAGWCWQIEHPDSINRGYVYSSAFISDDAAREEFVRKNPLAKTWDRPVKFRSGRHQRMWVDNVLAIGNAAGFVEPLESTALMIVCSHCELFVQFLETTHLDPTHTIRDLYNHVTESTWEEVRDFLSLHYRFNNLLDTPFWQQCREKVDLAGAAPLVEFYQENGPTGLCRHRLRNTLGSGNQFGLDGFLVMLVGNRVPYGCKHCPSEAERKLWNQKRAQFRAQAANGVTADEALTWIRHPAWSWNIKRAEPMAEFARA